MATLVALPRWRAARASGAAPRAYVLAGGGVAAFAAIALVVYFASSPRAPAPQVPVARAVADAEPPAVLSIERALSGLDVPMSRYHSERYSFV